MDDIPHPHARHRHAPTAEGAAAIANADARQAYRDLSPYLVRLALEGDRWHVDYELKDSGFKGVGPHYLIDPTSGAIITKRYDE